MLADSGIRQRRLRLPGVRRLTRGAALGAGVGREVLRHYPHLAERLSGIARAAAVPLEAVMELLVEATYAGSGGSGALAAPSVCVGVGEAGEGPLLVRTFAPALPWVLRTSRPEVGFASVELTLPWFPSAVAGVNEQGLAAFAVPTAAPAPAGARIDTGLGAAPAWLLVQECLQRFDSLGTAAEWCANRPAAGALAVVLQEAGGALARVEFQARERRLSPSDEGFDVAGEPPEACERVRKQLEAGGWDATGRAAEDVLPGSRVVLAPAEATLRLVDPPARASAGLQPPEAGAGGATERVALCARG